MRRSLLLLLLAAAAVAAEPPSTLSGPARPATVPLGDRGHAVDLPDTDPRVRRRVKGWAPEQIAVALSAAPSSAWVSWITGEFQMGGAVEPLDPGTVASVVRYGLAADSLLHEAAGESLVYSQLYPFEGFRNYTSGIIHHVRLQGLQPGTKYFYQCGDPGIPDAMSAVHAFTTMPAVGPNSYPGRIAVVGDLGLTYNTTSTVEHMVRNQHANLYLTNGTGTDCYSCTFAKSTPIQETYQPRWDYWGRFMDRLMDVQVHGAGDIEHPHDGGGGEPRDRGADRQQDVCILQLQVRVPVRGERVLLPPVLLLRRRRHPFRHACVVRRLQQIRGAIPMAGERPGEGGPVSDPVADSRVARALVHHLQGSLQGGRVHEGGDGGAPLLLRRRPRLHRPCARVRAVEPGVQLHAGPVRPRAHLGGRRRQPGEDGGEPRGRAGPLPGPGVDAGPLHGRPPLRRQLHVGPRRGALLLGPPAGVQRLQGEQLRPRRPGGEERHARALAVAPQPGPLQRRRRRGGHRPGAPQVHRQVHQLGLLTSHSSQQL